MSLTAETSSYQHISDLFARDIPLVFFDRVCDEVNTAKITTDDLESSYKATQHLVDCGCKKIALLSISNCLSISNKRLQGYEQALKDNNAGYEPINILCKNNAAANYGFLLEMMRSADRPDGIVATVEKLTTDIYLVCKELKLNIPQDLKIVSFSNLSSASILNPSLTTITQPAFEMGKAAAIALFKSLEKKNVSLKEECLSISSELIVRGSTVSDKVD